MKFFSFLFITLLVDSVFCQGNFVVRVVDEGSSRFRCLGAAFKENFVLCPASCVNSGNNLTVEIANSLGN
jgi:hypothetical protein